MDSEDSKLQGRVAGTGLGSGSRERDRKQQLMTLEERNAGKGISTEEHQERVGLKGETAEVENH